MNGWGDTLITSFFLSVSTMGTIAAVLPASRDQWWTLIVGFLVAFSGNVLQHRRQPKKEQA